MVKYLFTDGTDGVKEVQTPEELQLLTDESPHPGKIRIWIFNTNEWISYASYKTMELPVKRQQSARLISSQPSLHAMPWMKKFLVFSMMSVALFLVYNFTKINWEKASPVALTAPRPANVPLMDMDSLISRLEETRGEKLDKTTKLNLRLRNTWPDKIIAQLSSERDTSSTGSIFYNMRLSIDNATGEMIDEAVLRLVTWKDGKLFNTDTFLFKNIGYTHPVRRPVGTSFKGDSLAIHFESIRAGAFNFCYSSAKPNHKSYDRWFCKNQNE